MHKLTIKIYWTIMTVLLLFFSVTVQFHSHHYSGILCISILNDSSEHHHHECSDFACALHLSPAVNADKISIPDDATIDSQEFTSTDIDNCSINYTSLISGYLSLTHYIIDISDTSYREAIPVRGSPIV